RAAAAAAAAGGARARRARARLRPGTLLLGGMQGHWGDGISLSSGIVAVRQYKQPRTRADPLREVPTEEEFSTDVKKVVSTKPVARCKWLTRGMEYAGTGRIAATVLYDIVTHPKFSSGFNSDLRTSMAQMLKANMHLFSQKQQRALLAAFVPADKADKGDKKRSRSRARKKRSRSRGRAKGRDRSASRQRSQNSSGSASRSRSREEPPKRKRRKPSPSEESSSSSSAAKPGVAEKSAEAGAEAPPAPASSHVPVFIVPKISRPDRLSKGPSARPPPPAQPAPPAE
ncbi:unnamed protein product, partial [Prorocentrum cordatum]